MNQKVDNRNYGIDLLKTLSMFMVVVLHVLLHSNILYSDLSTPQYWAGWLLELFAYCAVNCFALASGFLLVDRPFRYRKLLPLWTTVFAWSAVISVAAFFIIPEKFNFSWVWNLLPVSSGAWWYFTAYVALFMLIPLLNKALANMSKRQWQLTVLAGFVLFCCSQTVFFWSYEPFKLNEGYSAWWLMYLYIVGAGIKRYDAFKSVNAARGGVAYLLCVLLTWGSKMALGYIGETGLPLISTVPENLLVRYTSPTVALSALFLMLFCLRVKIPDWMKKPLALLAPLIFQVYVIHLHPLVWNNLLAGRFSGLTELGTSLFILSVLGIALGIFAVCLLLDSVRVWVFKLLRVQKLLDRVADLGASAVNKILK